MNDHPANPVNVFEQINSICSEYRHRLKAGENPQIEDLLESFDADARETLFRNLMHIDIDFKRIRKEELKSDDYIQRFPEYARIIRQAFYESTMMSMDASVSTPRFNMRDQLPDVTVDMPVLAANRLGDYHLIKEIGRGGFGIVYQAKHVQRQNPVALKTLPIGQDHHGKDDAERLHKFRREFRSLADINHPNLIGMQTLEVDGNQWFFTMDLIEGDDFLGYVRPDEQLDEQRLRAVLPQLANGMMALHGQRIIHRDMKPSNVLVDHQGKVTILDFGLVVELEQRTDQTMSMQTSRFAGTPLYASPEQIISQSTAASDWYSLGVMLYEALSGERPFSGSAIEVFEQKRHRDVPSLVGRQGIPNDLAEFTLQLMLPDQDKRPDALEIAKILSLETESRTLASIDEELAETIDSAEQFLIGREKQLGQLDELLQQLMTERKAVSVFITGRSGEGKTSLAEKFLSPLRLGTDVLVLSGRCYDRESVPFKAIDSLIDSLVAFLRGRKQEDVAGMLTDDVRMLANLFPVLGRVDAIAELCKTPVGQLDSKQIRFRAFAALRELLRKIGQATPILIFIDDLQWGDSDSADVLFRMLSPPDAVELMLLGSYRGDEADESPFLTEWEKLRSAVDVDIFKPNVPVGPLSESHCIELVIRRIGVDNDSIRGHAAELFRSTGGNPYFLDQLIDCFDPDTGSFSPAPLDEVIELKLAKLSADASPLLETIAVSGQSISIEEASRAARLTASAFSTITHMRSERLVRMIGSAEHQLVDTYHDKIRETVLDGLSDESRRQLHLRIAETIEQTENMSGNDLLQAMEQGKQPPETSSSPRVFDLAYHFDEAREVNRAFAYSILAAEQARDQFALPVSIEHFRSAEGKLKTNHSRGINYRVKFGFGSTLALAGQYGQANKLLSDSIEFANNELEAILAKSELADIVYKTGSLVDSMAACESLLAELGLPVPKTRLGKWIGIVRSRTGYYLDVWTKGWFSRISQKNGWQIPLLTKVLLQFAYPSLWRERNSYMWAASVAYDLAKRQADPKLKCLAASFQAMSYGWHKCSATGANKFGGEAEKLAVDLNDANYLGVTSLNWGAALAATGKFDESISEIGNAVTQFKTTGDVWRMAVCSTSFAWTHGQCGQACRAQKVAKQAFETAIQFGQSRLAQLSLYPWVLATTKQLPFDELAAGFRLVPDDLVGSVWFHNGRTLWLLKSGQTEESLRSAKKSKLIANELYPYSGLVCTAFPILAHALRQRAAEIKESDPLDSAKLGRQAFCAAKDAVLKTRKSTVGLPYALRELSYHYESKGKIRRAHRQTSKSCAIAKKQNAKYEYAQSLLVCGRLGEKLGKPDAKQQLEQAETKLAEFEKQMEQATLESFGKNVG